MHTTAISPKCLVFIGLLSLCSIRRASSRECYICESGIDASCLGDVNNDALRFDCANVISNNIKPSAEHLPALLQYYSLNNITDYDCLTIVGKAFDETSERRIIRACIPTTETCENLHMPLLTSGLGTDLCDSCDGDLCNSRSQTIASEPELARKDAVVENNAESMKFDRLRMGTWCAIVLLLSTVFRC